MLIDQAGDGIAPGALTRFARDYEELLALVVQLAEGNSA